MSALCRLMGPLLGSRGVMLPLVTGLMGREFSSPFATSSHTENKSKSRAPFSDFARAIRSNDVKGAKSRLISGAVDQDDLSYVHEEIQKVKSRVTRGLAHPSVLKNWDDIRALSTFLSQHSSIYSFMQHKFRDQDSSVVQTVRVSKCVWKDEVVGVVLVARCEGVKILEKLRDQLNKRDPSNLCSLSRLENQYYLQLNPQAWIRWVNHEPLALSLLEVSGKFWERPSPSPVLSAPVPALSGVTMPLFAFESREEKEKAPETPPEDSKEKLRDLEEPEPLPGMS